MDWGAQWSVIKVNYTINPSTYVFCRLSETKRRSLFDPVYFGPPSWWTWVKLVSELLSRRKYPEISSWAPLQPTIADLYRTEHQWNPIRYGLSLRRIDSVFGYLLSVYIFSGSGRDRWFLDEIQGMLGTRVSSPFAFVVYNSPFSSWCSAFCPFLSVRPQWLFASPFWSIVNW